MDMEWTGTFIAVSWHKYDTFVRKMQELILYSFTGPEQLHERGIHAKSSICSPGWTVASHSPTCSNRQKLATHHEELCSLLMGLFACGTQIMGLSRSCRSWIYRKHILVASSSNSPVTSYKVNGIGSPSHGYSLCSSSRVPSPVMSMFSLSHNGYSTVTNQLAGSTTSVEPQSRRTSFRSPLFKLRRAPLLHVFVPSPDGDWLSDNSVLECESQLRWAGVMKPLQPGDIIWNVAVGDEGNIGRLVWDGNFLIMRWRWCWAPRCTQGQSSWGYQQKPEAWLPYWCHLTSPAKWIFSMRRTFTRTSIQRPTYVLFLLILLAPKRRKWSWTKFPGAGKAPKVSKHGKLPTPPKEIYQEIQDLHTWYSPPLKKIYFGTLCSWQPSLLNLLLWLWLVSLMHGNANVLQLLCGERIPRVDSKALHPCVRNAVQEDDEWLNKFCSNMITRQCTIPSPM